MSYCLCYEFVCMDLTVPFLLYLQERIQEWGIRNMPWLSWCWNENNHKTDRPWHDPTDEHCLPWMQRIRYAAGLSFIWEYCSTEFILEAVQCLGEIISDKDKCPSCKGNKVVQEKKVLEVHVEKGMQHNQKIVFQGQADEAVSLCYSLHMHAHICILSVSI